MTKDENISSPQTEKPVSKKVLKWTITPKGKSQAYVGCKVLHADGSVGEIAEGSSSFSLGGKKAARIGDKVQCPGHTGVILEGSVTFTIGGKGLARIGDRTSCGGVIVEGIPSVTVFDRTRTAHGEGEKHGREIRFKLTQSAHAQQGGYAGMPYKLFVDGAQIGEGETDEDGELIIFTDEEKEVKEYEIRFGNGESYLLSLTDSFEEATEKDYIATTGFHVYDNLGADYAQKYKELAEGKTDTEEE